MTAPCTCPRCGIEHRDTATDQARGPVLCADCQPYGRSWAKEARREVRRMARAFEVWNAAQERARRAYYAEREAS